MRASAISPASPLGRAATIAAALLLAASLTIASSSAFADEATDESKSEPTGEPEGQPGALAPTLVSYLADGSLRVSADVELADDPEPVLGSFMADGLTYVVTGEGEVTLVAVAPNTLAGSLAGDPAGAEGAAPGNR